MKMAKRQVWIDCVARTGIKKKYKNMLPVRRLVLMSAIMKQERLITRAIGMKQVITILYIHGLKMATLNVKLIMKMES